MRITVTVLIRTQTLTGLHEAAIEQVRIKDKDPFFHQPRASCDRT